VRVRVAICIGALCAVLALIVRTHDIARGAPSPAHLTLVAYSTPRDAFGELIKAFQATESGAGVNIDASYGGSGEQSRAVQNGLPADIVAFSLEPDIGRLVDSGLVAPNWNQTSTHGMVTRSVVVLVVRRGNPKHIASWNDLVRPGIEVITPNPFTSGGARWNIAAAYGAQLQQGRTQEQAATYLRDLFDHIAVQDKSAREAMQTFVAGKGDVMIAYESEAILAQQKKLDIDYVVPRPTILIENPIAVTKSTGNPSLANAFVNFCLSTQGQTIFSKYGYRPVVELPGHPLQRQNATFSIDYLGGWSSVDRTLFDPSTGLVAKIEQDLGVSGAGR